MSLYRLKLSIEKCVLAEELKILLHDGKLAALERAEREEERLAPDLRAANEQKALADEQLVEGRKALADMKEKLVELNEIDKAFEKNFKREFPKCNYNQLEALGKAFKYARFRQLN